MQITGIQWVGSIIYNDDGVNDESNFTISDGNELIVGSNKQLCLEWE